MSECPYIVGNECDIAKCEEFHVSRKEKIELLDKVAESITEIYKCNLYCAEDYCDKEQCQNAEDCFYGAIIKAIERLKAEVEK